MEASLQQILDAREKRVQKQRSLIKQFQKPLVCFTMNIPGPEKYNRDVSIGFFVGCKLLENALHGKKILHREIHREITGCEGYYIVDMSAIALKQLTVSIEDTDSIGRLFDMDVLDADGQKLSRETLNLPKRTCLLCNADAVVCARSRRHPLEQLQEKTGFLLYLAARQYLCEYIAVQGYFALQQEVSTTPKPGLVDRNNHGSHKDMNMRHFFASANALRPYLCSFAETGFLTRDLSPEETFSKIRKIGKDAEKAMIKATHGVNTHKGAIFSLGILCAAAGRLPPDCWQPEQLLAVCAAMTKGLTLRDFAGITPDAAQTAGERLYALHGIAGVRGQAESGFPAVESVGLPILHQGLNKGLSFNDAGCITLLYLISEVDDTNLIHRSRLEKQLSIRSELKALLAQTPFPTMDTIIELDKRFIAENLSPGGCADLLALTYFLYFLQA